jgi:hypothetical protein
VNALPPARRDIELLRTACRSCDDDVLEQLSVGRRDRLLLELREALFGGRMNCTTQCPACGDPCEWSCTVTSLCEQSLEASAAGARETAGDVAGVYEWSNGTWRVRFRAVSAADLVSLSDCADESTATGRLLARCVVEAFCDEQSVTTDQLPAVVVDELSAAMEQADGQASLDLALTCPTCAHSWQVDFDVGEFLWMELDGWARRMIAEVHQLAQRYGWSERDILSMTPTRRARYLAMGVA